MKKHRLLAYIFAALAILLSNVMCATVAYSYCSLEYCGRYLGCSAPPDAAFLYCIPYGASIIICGRIARGFARRARG